MPDSSTTRRERRAGSATKRSVRVGAVRPSRAAQAWSVASLMLGLSSGGGGRCIGSASPPSTGGTIDPASRARERPGMETPPDAPVAAENLETAESEAAPAKKKESWWETLRFFLFLFIAAIAIR